MSSYTNFKRNSKSKTNQKSKSKTKLLEKQTTQKESELKIIKALLEKEKAKTIIRHQRIRKESLKGSQQRKSSAKSVNKRKTKHLQPMRGYADEILLSHLNDPATEKLLRINKGNLYFKF